MLQISMLMYLDVICAFCFLYPRPFDNRKAIDDNAGSFLFVHVEIRLSCNGSC